MLPGPTTMFLGAWDNHSSSLQEPQAQGQRSCAAEGGAAREGSQPAQQGGRLIQSAWGPTGFELLKGL